MSGHKTSKTPLLYPSVLLFVCFVPFVEGCHRVSELRLPALLPLDRFEVKGPVPGEGVYTYTVYRSLYAVHCTLYTVHCTLYTVHCTLYIVYYTMYSVSTASMIVSEG